MDTTRQPVASTSARLTQDALGSGRRRGLRALVLLVAAIATALWIGCEESPPLPLVPFGPDPNAGGDSLCFSDFSQIKIVGEFSSWNIAASPRMVQGGPECAWSAVIEFDAAGETILKFLTGESFDEPGFVGDESQVLGPSQEHELDRVQTAGGTGNAITVEIPAAGFYQFQLFEDRDTFRFDPVNAAGDLAGVVVFAGKTGKPLPVAWVRVVENSLEVAAATTSSDDGSFAIEGIDQGLYEVHIEPPLLAPTHADSVIEDVWIGGGRLNLGQVHVRKATGQLKGEVGFQDFTGTPPPASIAVQFNGESAAAVRTTPTGRTFSISGLKPATYTVEFAAEGFVDSTILVEVGSGTVDVGRIDLERLICAAFPTLEAMKLGGRRLVNDEPSDDTFSWNPGLMPVMTRLGRCVWEVDITAQFTSIYRIKFITNGDFVAGDPPAFGGDDETVIPADSLASVVGDPVPGTANAIRIEIAQTGIYRFRLDLSQVAFSFTRVDDLPDDGPPAVEGVLPQMQSGSLNRRTFEILR